MAQQPFSFGSLNNSSTGFGRGLKLNTLSTGGSGFNIGNTLGGPTVSIGSTTQTTSEIEKTLIRLAQGGQLAANITKATKFSDLSESDQKLIVDIEQYIQNQNIIMSNIESTHLPDLNDYVKEVANESRTLFQKLASLMNELRTTHSQIDERLKDLEDQIKMVDNGKRFYDAASQGQSGNVLQIGDNIFAKYYHDLVISFEERLRQYSSTIDEIERHFSSLAQNRSNDTENKELASLNESMRSQHQSFMVITGKVATLHEEMDKLREKYLRFRRTYSHDNSNPFEIQKEPSIDIARETSFNERKPAQELAKNLPVVTSAAQLNQLNPPSQIELIRPATQPLVQPSQPNLFGQSSQTSLFGQTNLFGQSTSQPSLFGSQQSLFGQTTSQPNLFGQSNFGQPASQPSLFGQSNFGQSTSQPSLFGQSGFGQPASQPSLFGQSNFGQSTSQPSLFGQSNFGQSTSQPSLFGQSGFGQPASQPSLFGQSSYGQSSYGQSTSLFGQTSQPSMFGQPNQFGQSTQPSLFGQPSQTSQASLFGQPGQSNAFGQPGQSNAFGQPSQSNAFGQPSQSNAFGQTSNKPPFNFRPTTTTTSSFTFPKR
ncbi:hypothetical protein RhiirA1_463341 [Rhizophagus irregularis]|uniref:Uncharacterized protein n=1 Tax=Rhizophagus irregularis TaxID=588596 RepID=A0A2N0RKD9_9GLOM|nr:hypothetical protein RhiirA1_463341 [Rhizophagus irregularis]